MARVIEVTGLDGTKDGWVAVTWAGPRTPGSALHVSKGVLRKFIANSAARTIVIDIPIGLVDEAKPGGRECDRLVRRDLTRLRGSSVFPTPVRGVLGAKSQEQASKINRDSSPHRIGVMMQAYNLLLKLREVDELMTPKLQKRVYEGHPEYSFFLMQGGQPMEHKKKSDQGRSDRVKLLVREGLSNAPLLVKQSREFLANADDIIDAMAMCWTAWRIAHQKAKCRPGPDTPQKDSKRLTLQIWG